MIALERCWLLGLALALLGSAALAIAWSPGQHASPDSAVYLDAARQLAEGNGYVTARIPRDRSEPAAISAWPPVFSLLLAGGIRVGLSGAQAAAGVLFLSFVAFAAGAYWLMLEASERRLWPLALGLCVPILLHPGTLRALDAIWSDLPFAAGCTGLLGLTLVLVRSDAPSLRAALGAGALAGGLVLVRWAGLYWIVPLALGLGAALAPRLGHREAWKRAGAFLAGAGALVLPWLARNLLRTGSLAGIRRAAPSDPLAAAGDAVSGVLSAVADVAGVAPVLIALAGVAGALALVTTRAWRDGRVAVLLAVGLGYPTLMVASWSLAPFDPLTRERFWLPLWPLAGALLLAVGVRCASRRKLAIAVSLTALAVMGPATFAFARTGLAKLPAARRATGLASPVWAESAPVRFLAEEDRDCTVVASEPRIHLIHNHLPVVYTLPERRDELAPLLARAGSLCLVYMRERSSGSAERRREAHLALIRSLEQDGIATRVAADRVGEVWLVRSLPGA